MSIQGHLLKSGENASPEGGAQRLPLEKLRAWEALEYGMFLHFGMSTFDGYEHSLGDRPATTYAPDQLDVDQWIRVARDAGMRYAVLTTKHVSGHCLWPTEHTDYHVGNSGNTTDVVGAFVQACRKYGLMPGLYYCCWDNHNRFGSMTPTFANGEAGLLPYTTEAYREFQRNQIEELLTRYGPVGEVWIDIPKWLTAEGRRRQYGQIAELAPEAVVMMNHGFGDGSSIDLAKVWPTDLMAVERWLPSSAHGYKPWFRFAETRQKVRKTVDEVMEESIEEAKDRYIPAEVCDPIGYDWFHVDGDPDRPVMELAGMRAICKARGANLLLNVPPDRRGVIPERRVETLMAMREAYEKMA